MNVRVYFVYFTYLLYLWHLMQRQMTNFASLAKPREGQIPKDGAATTMRVESNQLQLDKNFGYNKNFGGKYDLGKEVGRGHFGHTCQARGRKGDLRDQPLAVKIISKAKVQFQFLFHQIDFS